MSENMEKVQDIQDIEVKMETKSEECLVNENIENRTEFPKKNGKKKRRIHYNPVDEARLTNLLLKDTSEFFEESKAHEIDIKTERTEIQTDSIVKNENISETDSLCGNDNVCTNDSLNKIEDTSDKAENKAVWMDEDDNVTVAEALENQNRKKVFETKETYYTEYLKNRHEQLIGTPMWARIRKEEEYYNEENEILKHSCHTVPMGRKNLPKERIEIKALCPINKQTHTEGPIVSSVEFHPSSTVALTAGSSGILSIFQIDGVQNTKLNSVHFKKFPISKARFLKNGDEVICGSQYNNHCHSYDLISGQINRIPLPHGVTNMSYFEISPDGKIIALSGRYGMIYLLSSLTKELIGSFKMNAECRAMAFTPDNNTLITHGDGSEMYVWDIKSRRCIHRSIDEGCLSCSSMALSPNGQFLATGSKQGVVNIYDVNTVLKNQSPKPLKEVFNLVTGITTLQFNATSEILAITSSETENAFRMLHLPSFTIFSNFPSYQTNMSFPVDVDFSPSSGYLGITNKSGSAFLYRLKHYGNY